LPHQSAEGSDGRDVGRSDLSAVLDPSEMPDAADAVVLPNTRPAGRGTPAWEIASLVAILGVAFVLRLCWLAIADAQPGVITSGDPFFYDYFARCCRPRLQHSVTDGCPPGYPAVLAVIFKLFGRKIVLAKP
jgi:hypothetical protein